ncbi:hypothetical protein ACFE04_009143 [Oxalis oulophora]
MDSDLDIGSDNRIIIGDDVTNLYLSNFDDIVTSRDFVFVYFFNPGCPVCCYGVTPEYETVAYHYFLWCSDKVLFAKVDAKKEKRLSREYNVWVWPQIKIFKNNPTHQVLTYDGPLDANGINTCLTTLMRPSPHYPDNINSSVIVGVFPEFSGYEYDNFNQVAQELQWDYVFHTTNKFPSSQHTKFLPPLILVKIKNSHEYIITKVFEVAALVKLIKDETIPDVTFYPQNVKQLTDFFFNATHNAKVALFINREGDNAEAFKCKYHEVAKKHIKQSINFMLGDLVDSRDAFRLFELHDCRMPIIVIKTSSGQKYVEVNLKPNDIAPWLEKYMADSLFSESVPRKMNINVKQIATSNFQELVTDSGKNVLLEVGPWCHWCGNCEKLHSVIDDVANFFQNDVGVVVAKLYKKSNEIRGTDIYWDYPDLQDRSSLYFKRASGEILKLYHGLMTKEHIIQFVKNNRDVVYQYKPVEIRSAVEANNLIGDNNIFVVGVFPTLSGQEYDNFIKVAKILKSVYDFGLTLDAKHLPLGDPTVYGPFVRLFKHFDEPFVDTKTFDVRGLVSFVKDASTPVVTLYNCHSPQHVDKFFYNGTKNHKEPSQVVEISRPLPALHLPQVTSTSLASKIPFQKQAMLFIQSGDVGADIFISKYTMAAKKYKGKCINFMLGDSEACNDPFWGDLDLVKSHNSFIVITNPGKREYAKIYLESGDNIETWIDDYKEGKIATSAIVKLFHGALPVCCGYSFDCFMDAKKDFLLAIYGYKWRHMNKLAILMDDIADHIKREKAKSKSDIDVGTAMMNHDYIKANPDVRRVLSPVLHHLRTLSAKDEPTLYFKSSIGTTNTNQQVNNFTPPHNKSIPPPTTLLNLTGTPSTTSPTTLTATRSISNKMRISQNQRSRGCRKLKHRGSRGPFTFEGSMPCQMIMGPLVCFDNNGYTLSDELGRKNFGPWRNFCSIN